jgi:arabinogalactan endo-1,4-beta-galactosidase
MRIKSLILSVILAIGAFAAVPQRASAFETGGDLSELTWEQNSEGVTFKNASGATVDPVALAQSDGWTCVRLRLLVDGNAGGALAQSLSYDLALATRIKAHGMHIILDIFYSNGWCDPGEQPTPSEWSSQSYTTLKATVQSYTASVITSFKNNGTLPDYVQVGNEISNGMLWPVGALTNQSQFVGLIKAGIAGVKQVSSVPKIILHCNGGADTSLVEWFFNTIASQCTYDIVGLSYYPPNGTNLSDIQAAMKTYKGMFGGRPIMLVEFGYPYNASPLWEGTGGYWTIPLGQQQICTALVADIRGDTQGDGVIYWGSTYVTGSWGWEALFDSTTHDAEPAFGSF